MLLTGDHDDRVVPLHSFKLAAALQHTLANNPNPLLLRVDLKAGHGAGKTTMARIQEAAEKVGFLCSGTVPVAKLELRKLECDRQWGFVAQTFGLEWNDGSKGKL
jgi:hypothetical protein